MNRKKLDKFFTKTIIVSYHGRNGRISLPQDWLSFWGYPKELSIKITAPFVVLGPAEAWEVFDFELIEKKESDEM
ncbi:MAG: hypothetical protein QXO20_06815 [Candidatus Bathyarchaeia archaeon]